jgi:hypothetical protein
MRVLFHQPIPTIFFVKQKYIPQKPNQAYKGNQYADNNRYICHSQYYKENEYAHDASAKAKQVLTF